MEYIIHNNIIIVIIVYTFMYTYVTSINKINRTILGSRSHYSSLTWSIGKSEMWFSTCLTIAVWGTCRNPFATGNTLMCGWGFEPADKIMFILSQENVSTSERFRIARNLWRHVFCYHSHSDICNKFESIMSYQRVN